MCLYIILGRRFDLCFGDILAFLEYARVVWVVVVCIVIIIIIIIIIVIIVIVIVMIIIVIIFIVHFRIRSFSCGLFHVC